MKYTSLTKTFFAFLFITYHFFFSSFTYCSQTNKGGNNSLPIHNLHNSQSPGYILLPGDLVEYFIYLNGILTSDDYTLSIGDRVEIKFIENSEFTVDQLVRPDGKISLPLIGDFFVSGHSPEYIRGILKSEYKNFISDPEIVIAIKERGGKIGDLQFLLRTMNSARITRVRSDGMLSIPGAGDVIALGKSIDSVKSEFDKLFLKNGIPATCDLILKESDGSAISIFGAVKNPGIYVMNYKFSIFDALSVAGGLRDDARRKISIIRKNGDSLQIDEIDLRKALKSKSGIKILPRDVIYVDRIGLSKASAIARYIGEIIFFRGFSSSIAFEPLKFFENE